MTPNTKNLLILDASSMLNHYYYGTKPLAFGNDHSINALNLFIKKLQYFKNYNQGYYTHIAICFDHSKELLERKKIYPEYKNQRNEKPEDFVWQLNHFEELISQLQIPVYAKDGIEADDFAGSIVKNLKSQMDHIDIITSDRDYFQLLDTNIDLLLLHRNDYDNYGNIILTDDPIGTRRFTLNDLKEQYCLTPEQIIDWKAISGDSSDNIPGIKGVGDKQALPLLQYYHNIENIIADIKVLGIETIKQKWKTELHIKRPTPKAFLDYEQIGLLSKRLATINQNLNVPTNVEAYEYRINPLAFQNLYIKEDPKINADNYILEVSGYDDDYDRDDFF